MKKNESSLAIITSYLGRIVGAITAFYTLLMVVVLPFYCEDGYRHIGTDKSVFFRTWSGRMAKLLLPFLILWLLCRAVTILRQAVEILRQGRIRDVTVREGIDRKVTVREVLRFREVFEKSGSFFSSTDLFALVYACGAVLSYLSSHYRETAWLGAAGWYMGLLPQLTLVAMYFLISRCCIGKKWLFALLFPVSAVVFVLGILNRFGFYPLDMKLDPVNPLFLSTIGNINWYCGYLVPVLFAGIGIFLVSAQGGGTRPGRWTGVALGAYIAIGFATLLTNGSSSGILTFAIMMPVLFVLAVAWNPAAAWNTDVMKRFFGTLLLFAGVCLMVALVCVFNSGALTYRDTVGGILLRLPVAAGILILTVLLYGIAIKTINAGKYADNHAKFLIKGIGIAAGAAVFLYIGLGILNTVLPGGLPCVGDWSFLRFNSDWGNGRGGIWYLALRCFREQDFRHKLFGVGPDCMWCALSDGGEEIHRYLTLWYGEGTRLTNAHNEWMTVLIDLGIPGLVGYVGMLVSAIWRNSGGLRIKQNTGEGKLAFACGVGVLAYVVNSFFSFQQTMGAVTLFVLLGLGEGFGRRVNSEA